MKKSPFLIAVMAAITIFAAPAKAAPGQQYIFTRGSLNGNICTSPGRNCHTPQQNLSMTTPPIMTARPNVIGSAPIGPAHSDSGIISSVISGLASLF